MTRRNVLYFKIDDKIFTQLGNEAVTQRINTVTDLMKKLSLDDDRRYETLDELIVMTHSILNTDAEFQIVGKDQLVEETSLGKRRAYALELLRAYREHLLKKLKKLKNIKTNKNKEDQAPILTQNLQQNQTVRLTQNLQQNRTVKLTEDLQQNKTITLSQTSPETIAFATRQLSYTGPTMNLNPSTGPTTRLATKKLGNKTIKIGKNEAGVTGKTIRLVTQKLSKETIVLPPIENTAASLPLSTTPLPISYTQYKKQIERNVDDDFRNIHSGTYGDGLRAEAEQDPIGVRSKLHRRHSQQLLTNYALQYPEEASTVSNEPNVQEAIDRADYLREGLIQKGVITGEMLDDPEFSKHFGLDELNNETYSGLLPTDSYSNNSEYQEGVLQTNARLLQAIEEKFPKLAAKYKPIFERAKATAETVKAKISARLGETTLGKAAAGAATKATASLAARGTLGFLAARGLQAIGTALAGPIGTLISTLLISVASFIKKNLKNIGQLGLGVLSIGLLIGNPIVGILGASMLGVSAAGGGLAGISSSILGLGNYLLAIVLTVLMWPFLSAFVITIVAVSLILFIINSGGFVTPQAQELSSIRAVTSFYMTVQKQANITNISNENLPRPVTYTIRIRANESDLTNISFENSYQIFQEPRLAQPPATAIPAPPATIRAGEEYTFTYETTYPSELQDSVVCDNFRITADAEGTTDSAEASACVTVGAPAVAVGCSSASGPDITAQLAQRITQAGAPTLVNLLPATLDPRAPATRNCITPTMIVMHWAGNANDNPRGNNQTYSTLVSRNLACQLMTDTDDVWLTQPFYANQVEMSWCANAWNIYSINNEMSGISFDSTPPPPNPTQLEYAYIATCELMEQYDIPWSQIRGHYEINPTKTDPGREFLQEVFIPEIRNRCPNDN